MIGSRTSPPLDVGVVGAGLAEGLALGLAEGDALGGAVDGAAVGDSAGELDAVGLAGADGAGCASTVNVHVTRSISPSSAEIEVDSTVNVPSVKGVSGRATMRRWSSGSMPPVATVEPAASLMHEAAVARAGPASSGR